MRLIKTQLKVEAKLKKAGFLNGNGLNHKLVSLFIYRIAGGYDR